MEAFLLGFVIGAPFWIVVGMFVFLWIFSMMGGGEKGPG